MINNPQRALGDVIGRLCAISIALYWVHDEANDSHCEGIGQFTDDQIAWLMRVEEATVAMQERVTDLVQEGHRLP